MEAVAFGWNAVIKDFGGVAVPIAVASFVASLPASLIYGIISVITPLAFEAGVDPSLVMMGGMPLVYLALLLTQAYFLGGIIRFAIAVARGEKPEFGLVFSGGSTFGSLFGGMLLFLIVVAIGNLLCIVPGYIVMFGCLLFAPLIVDKGLGAVDSLKESWELTKGHKLNLFVLWLLLILVNIAGLAACCIGSLLVSTPVMSLALAFVYLRLTGQHPRLPAAA